MNIVIFIIVCSGVSDRVEYSFLRTSVVCKEYRIDRIVSISDGSRKEGIISIFQTSSVS